MSHVQYSVMKLTSSNKRLAKLLKPYLEKEFHFGCYHSECISFDRIFNASVTTEIPEHITEEYKRYRGRPFIVDGRFHGNEYFFSSINQIPFPVYQRLSMLIGEQFSVEVHSTDDFYVGKWEFRPDGLMCTVFYKEDPCFYENPESFGLVPKSLRGDMRIKPSLCVDREGNKFEDMPHSQPACIVA